MRRLLLALAFLASTATAGLGADAAAVGEPRVLRIGTGGLGGTYHPIGTIIAQSLSDGAMTRQCGGESCGVPGVLAVAQASNGSVANVEALRDGAIEIAFAQGDVVHWAYNGTGRFEGRLPMRDLRVVATLYAESVHLVARSDAGIRGVRDLQGRRVSLDEPGSGTLLDAREVLRAFGLSENDVTAEYVKPDLALARMAEGKLDAFFIVAGAPVGSLRSAFERQSLTLVPITGPPVDGLLKETPYHSRATIPDGTYRGIGPTATVAVGAQLVVRADLDPDLVYAITRALWSDTTRASLESGHPKGREIRLDHALDGVAIPLHPGAERFYREKGIVR